MFFSPPAANLTTTGWVLESSLRSRLRPPASTKLLANILCCAAFCTSAAAYIWVGHEAESRWATR